MGIRLKSIFGTNYTEKERQLFDFLRLNVLFRNLSNRQLSRIAPHLFLRSFKQDEVVFFRNDPSLALYIIKRGRVKLYLDSNQGEEEVLISLEHGFLFGQNCILEKAKRNYSAIVVSDGAEIYALPRVSLIETMEKDKTLDRDIHAALAQYYSEYIAKVFTTYHRNFGFFELSHVYDRLMMRTD